MVDEEYDLEDLGRFLVKYADNFTDTEQSKFFCIGYLVAQGYSFTLAEHLASTIY